MTVHTLHNQRIPAMPRGLGLLVPIEPGHATFINDRQILSVSTERDAVTDETRLVFRIHLRCGSTFRADSPEALNYLTSDAVVRRVDSDDRGPRLVLVEIGEYVAFPALRDAA